MRLFIAIPLPDEVRARLGLLTSGVPAARWVRPENMHLTLRFLGEVADADAAHLDDVLSGLDDAAFSLRLSGLGTFGRGHKTRALWTGADGGPALMHLQDKIERVCQMQGFPPEARKFSAHVTLARFKMNPGKKLADFLEAHAGFATDPFWVDHFVLYRSHTGNEAPHYETLRTYDLRA